MGLNKFLCFTYTWDKFGPVEVIKEIATENIRSSNIDKIFVEFFRWCQVVSTNDMSQVQYKAIAKVLSEGQVSAHCIGDLNQSTVVHFTVIQKYIWV